MKHTLLYPFLCLLIFSSCKSTYSYYSIEPEVVSYNSKENIPFTEETTDDITIRSAFVGYGIDYAIFQLEIENNSDQGMDLTYEDVRLVHTDGFQRNAYHKYNFIKKLKGDQVELKKQKKASTIGNAVLAGFTVLTIASGGGALNGLDAAVVGVDSASGILADRRSFDLASGDIEQEMNYFEEWVLFESYIPAGSSVSRDVIFPVENLTTDFDMVLQLEDREYRIPYDNILKTVSR